MADEDRVLHRCEHGVQPVIHRRLGLVDVEPCVEPSREYRQRRQDDEWHRHLPRRLVRGVPRLREILGGVMPVGFLFVTLVFDRVPRSVRRLRWSDFLRGEDGRAPYLPTPEVAPESEKVETTHVESRHQRRRDGEPVEDGSERGRRVQRRATCVKGLAQPAG